MPQNGLLYSIPELALMAAGKEREKRGRK